MFEYYFGKLLEQLSLDFNCTPEDLQSGENIVTTSVLLKGRRWYTPVKPFLQMVTTGRNVVVMADERIQDFMRDYIKGKPGHWFFEHRNLSVLDEELKKYGYKLTQSHHMFLPCRDVTVEEKYPVKWFFGEDIKQFYGDERFPNAICPEFTPERPDRIAAIAYDGDKIMGMAGCSEDAPGWEQIGIDVMPEYRSKGVGSYLVTLVKNKIIERGEIPFYGTAAANLHSQNIALNCGFKPAWVEVPTLKPEG